MPSKEPKVPASKQIKQRRDALKEKGVRPQDQKDDKKGGKK